MAPHLIQSRERDGYSNRLTVVDLKLYYQVSEPSVNLPFYRVSAVSSSLINIIISHRRLNTLRHAFPNIRPHLPASPTITVSFILTTLMGVLRFVIEAPQLSQTPKKRPRKVTSCDNWCVARSCLALVDCSSVPFASPNTQPSEENQVCPGQFPAPLWSLRVR